MRRSRTPSLIEKWTKEDVHRWLVTEVKVHKTLADRFVDEEVSGEILVVFEKTDIVDLGLKHGPAVKIRSHLERLKDASQHESQFPAYVENWTKEQVNQWLLQHVNVYRKYSERLLEEDVSGDCLVCLRKQDLLDLDIKSGPAVKILAELHQLNKKPEPTLQPILHTSTEKKEAPKPNQPDLSLAQTTETRKPESKSKTEMVQNEPEQIKLFGMASKKEEVLEPKPQILAVKRKETVVVTFSSCCLHQMILCLKLKLVKSKKSRKT